MFKGVSSLVLFCGDTAVSSAWYQRVGFKVLREYGGMVWLDAGGGTEIMLHPAAGRESGAACVIHVGVPDVVALFQKVKAAGLRPYDHQQPDREIHAPVTMPWGAVEFELTDPDGARIAFTQVAA